MANVNSILAVVSSWPYTCLWLVGSWRCLVVACCLEGEGIPNMKVLLFATVMAEYDVDCLTELGCARDLATRLQGIGVQSDGGVVVAKVIMVKDKDDSEVRGWEV